MVKDPPDCPECDGTGEGQYERERCIACNGRGFYLPRRKRSGDDFDTEIFQAPDPPAED